MKKNIKLLTMFALIFIFLSSFTNATEILCENDIDDDFDGFIDSDDQDCFETIELTYGWNLIGYSFPTNNIESALSSIEDCYSCVFGWENGWELYCKDRETSSNTLSNLEYGKGYWININCNRVELTYSIAQQTLKNNLEAYWPLNSDFQDKSGNGKHLSNCDFETPVLQSEDCVLGGCVTYNDEDQGLCNVNFLSDIDKTKWSWSAWVNVNSLTQNYASDKNHNIFFFQEMEPYHARGLRISGHELWENQPVQHVSNGIGFTYKNNFEQSVSINTWYNIIASGNETHLNIYVNGIKGDTVEITNNGLNFENRLIVGRHADLINELYQTLDGSLDELAYWSRTLNDADCQVGEACGGEIGALYNNGLGYNPVS